MPYVGGKLAPLYEVGPTRAALTRMAKTGGDSLHDWVVRNTPIDTGNLRTSWYSMAVRELPSPAGRVYERRVRTEVSYAPYVEHGTGLYGPKHAKYLIEPNKAKALSWVDGGGRVFASRVWHPGSPGAHMMESAAAKVEALYSSIQKENLAIWKRECEALEAKAMAAGLRRSAKSVVT